MAFEIQQDPTRLSFEEYSELDIDTRISLVDIVYERYSGKIESYIGKSACWILVCGPDCEVIQTANTYESVLTDDEIWTKASEIGYAPYQFFKYEQVEDLATA